MKKLTFLMAAIAMVLGLGSCSEDRDPVYQAPTNFVLNTPAMQDQYIQLTEGQVLELVASQPDYGYSAIANYSAQMSLTEDFAQVYDLPAADGTANKARFVVNQSEVAMGILELQGVKDEESFKAAYPDGMKPQVVYFRAVCELNGVEGSKITSNVVSYNQLVGYFAVPVPGYIYLVGSPEGWAGPDEGNAAHYADWRLFEADDAIGSKVYTGVFDIPADPTFRFYTALTGWSNGDSYGTQEDDNPIDYPELTTSTSSFAAPAVKGKGSYHFPNWEGGKMTITVDMSDMSNITVTILPGEHQVMTTKYIYLVGAISGWMAPEESNETAYNQYRLACSDGTNVYTAKFPVTAGDTNFRFALSLSASNGWDNPDQIGSQENDADVECSLTNGTFSGSYVSGKGNWKFSIPEDGFLSLTVDTNSKTMTAVFSKD